MLDLVFRHAQVLDGTGRDPFGADVGVLGDTIAAVGDLSDAQAARTINLHGLTLAPGFIDAHSHTDSGYLRNPSAESKIAQGVTTEICGNCGGSPAPTTEDMRLGMADADAGPGAAWSSLAEFFTVFARNGMGNNFATYVGHQNLRINAMGYVDRAPTSDELERMQTAAAEAMAQGAIGLSTGLIYAPGCYAKTDEIAELCRPVAAVGGIYGSHLRGEGDHLLEGVEEALAVGRAAGVQVQLSHHKATSRRNWGKVRDSLALMDSARAQGMAVAADQYPYLATSTSLQTTLPAWVREGGRMDMLARLRDPAARKRIAAQIAPTDLPPDHWEALRIGEVHTEANRWVEGLSTAEIARRRKQSVPDAIFDLLLEEEARVSMVRFAMCEEDVEMVMRHPQVMVGSDASARKLTGDTTSGKPHPRAFGTFPRVLGHYVRERHVISLSEAIRKMTSLPAQTFRLAGRGVVREGHRADLVVFDPDVIIDRATFDEPAQSPIGIHHVLVNGRLVVEQGALTRDLPGRVLVKRIDKVMELQSA